MKILKKKDSEIRSDYLFISVLIEISPPVWAVKNYTDDKEQADRLHFEN